MALSGNCSTSTWTSSDQSQTGKLTFYWTATQNKSNNTSTISWNIKAVVTGGWITYSALSVKINGSSVYSRGESTHTQCSNGTQLASGTKTITHNANGTASFSVEIGAGIYSWAINRTGSGSFTLDTIPTYTLSISAGTGSSITVNRTSSGYGSTGSLSNGAKLYYNDKLTVSFSASSGYGLSTHQVNGTTVSSGSSVTVSGNVSVTSTALAAYTLSINAGTGSSISVNRTSSGVAGNGTLNNGATIYKNDTLKVSFTASDNYEITTHTVNGSTFTSGNTHTVNGNVSVVSAARVLSSSVSATDAYIQAESTITVTRYNSSYYHSLQYSFGSRSGYITSSGNLSASEVKFNNSVVQFVVPSIFYTEIPNEKSGVCTITCRTYESATSQTQIGQSTTCTFIASVNEGNSYPRVIGTVTDVNNTTIALTGDASTLIRYKSNAECVIQARSMDDATIVARYINGIQPTQYPGGDFKTIENNVSSTKFVFSATDSRDFTRTYTIEPPNITIIEYVLLTCNPTVVRDSQTGGSLDVYLSGNYYRGAFGSGQGAVSNTLEISYQYKESSSVTWSALEQITPTITYGNSTYSTSFTIQLNDPLAYKKAYDIRVYVKDGHTTVNNSDIYLTELVKTISIPRGEPVFDWGQSDFCVNVELNVNDNMNVAGDVSIDGSASVDSDINITGDADVGGDLGVAGSVAILGDITVNGNSIAIKQKVISLSNVPITTQSSVGAYYCSGYSPGDYDISGTIIGLMLERWTGAAASFVPYYQSSTIRFISDVSQTVGSIDVLVTYI